MSAVHFVEIDARLSERLPNPPRVELEIVQRVTRSAIVELRLCDGREESHNNGRANIKKRCLLGRL